MKMCKFFNFVTLLATLFMQYLVVSSFDTSVHNAYATCYGSADASGTQGGACGYGDLFAMGYNTETAALSTALFNSGASCGQCYKIACNYNSAPSSCLQGTSITITATNFCPPNYNLPNDNGGWCNPPREHFDMSQPAFEKIALYSAGIVPITYQRVPCAKNGGIRFTVNGFTYFNLVLIWNVGGAGSIKNVWVKGSTIGWLTMQWNWGANWQANAINLDGQTMSFLVTNTDSQTMLFQNLVTSTWSFGITCEANGNFV